MSWGSQAKSIFANKRAVCNNLPMSIKWRFKLSFPVWLTDLTAMHCTCLCNACLSILDLLTFLDAEENATINGEGMDVGDMSTSRRSGTFATTGENQMSNASFKSEGPFVFLHVSPACTSLAFPFLGSFIGLVASVSFRTLQKASGNDRPLHALHAGAQRLMARVQLRSNLGFLSLIPQCSFSPLLVSLKEWTAGAKDMNRLSSKQKQPNCVRHCQSWLKWFSQNWWVFQCTTQTWTLEQTVAHQCAKNKIGLVWLTNERRFRSCVSVMCVFKRTGTPRPPGMRARWLPTHVECITWCCDGHQELKSWCHLCWCSVSQPEQRRKGQVTWRGRNFLGRKCQTCALWNACLKDLSCHSHVWQEHPSLGRLQKWPSLQWQKLFTLKDFDQSTAAWLSFLTTTQSFVSSGQHFAWLVTASEGRPRLQVPTKFRPSCKSRTLQS